MHLHGVILDLYDDPNATVLLAKLANEPLPSELANSDLLEAEKLAAMPDRLFALVADNGPDVVRKYAMHDAPHVATSVVYFLEKGHQLPDSMQKIAAKNLLAACEWYALQPPEELMKRAGALDAGFGLLDAKQRLDTTMAGSKATMDGFRAAQAGASSDMQARKEKTADLNGTEMMPMSGSISTLPSPRNTAKMPSTSPGSKRANWEHAGDLTNHRITEKVATIKTAFCLPSIEKYPIDSYEEVKLASSYFEEHWNLFSLEDRREYAVNLSNRLDELGLPSGERLAKYAGHSYGPHIDAEIASRISNYAGTEHQEMYEVLREKKAMTPPHVMLDMIYMLDEASGASEKYASSLGFRDPFQAVYGKVAAVTAPWTWSEGNEYVSDTMLKDLAVNRYQSLDRAFGVDMRKSFQKDPISVFESLPDPQKVVVSRLAADDSQS